MRSGTIAAISVTGVIVLLVGIASGVVGWMMWALALNGFMGQPRAVETSMMVYIVLAVISALICVALSALAVYFLSGKWNWHAAGSAALSIVVFAVTTGVLHTICVVVSAVVADQLRTNR
jgi:hypothetical protein